MSAAEFIPPELVPLLTTVLKDVRLMRSIFLVSLALILYDYLLTLDDEVAYIWQRKKTWTSVLFFLNRYWPIAYIAFDIIVMTTVLSPSTNLTVNSSCNIWFHLVAYTPELSHLTIQAILILRIHAMYSQNKILLGMMCSFLACEIVIELVLLGIITRNLTMLSLPGLELGCLPSNNTPWFWAFWLSMLVFETILFFLSLFKSVQLAFADTRTPNLMSVLLRDSIVYFGGVLAVILTNFIIWVAAKGPLWLVFILTPSMVHSIIGCRMLLNIRKAAEPIYVQHYLSNFRTGHNTTLRATDVEPMSSFQLRVFQDHSSNDLETKQTHSV